uniref:F-box domain-containing protein n=1 Tax=Chenopodium quinoa TaxID=63459 RepID=A0A803LAY3_CHEQI
MPSDSSLSSPKPNPNKRISQNKDMNIPNWLDLPEEIWFIILSKVNTIDIIESVEIVCRLFRNICKQPSMYDVIDMTLPDEYIDDDNPDYVNSMTLFAVDRSSGNLVDIYLEILCDDETLIDIVERSRNLKHLRLGHHVDISDRELVEAVKRLPMLEEVELNFCCFYDKTIEIVGRACPSLKSFSVNNVWPKNYKGNYEVMAIARSMPNLRSLQLIGNSMTNEGLEAILDGCPLLESLDIRACFHIDLSGDLGKRCEQIKHFRPPSASLEHFRHQACKCNSHKTHTPSVAAGHLIYFIDNEVNGHGDGEDPEYVFDDYSVPSSPSYSPRPGMDYDEWIDSLMNLLLIFSSFVALLVRQQCLQFVLE